MQLARGVFDREGESNSEEAASERVAIGAYLTERKAHEAGLSILACGHAYWVYPSEDGFVLVVRSEKADVLRREVEIAALRNRFWPPPSLELSTRTISKLPTAGAIAVLCFAFLAQSQLAWLKEAGMNSSEAVLGQGEWWRIATAVTLHADLGHLAGNLLGLSIFGYLSCRYMGSGLAWCLILLAAGLSNLTNDWLRWGEPYQSLGASTAVFSALGLLTGFPLGTYLRSKEPLQNRDWMIPFFGGCILFAWMGGGDFPTDVPGHLWSFAYGLMMGTLISWRAIHARFSSLHQSVLLWTVPVILIACWAAAVSQKS